MHKYSSIFREIKELVMQMQPERFWAIWLVALSVAVSYLIQSVRWW